MKYQIIRENITPRGDGNTSGAIYITRIVNGSIIRENITPRGDGNKATTSFLNQSIQLIRENITPRGDGNKLHRCLLLTF